MKLKPWRDGVWLFLNGVFGTAFLWLSSAEWLEPELKSVPGASGGGPVAFFFLVETLLLPAFLFNVGWLAWATRKSASERDWTPAWVFAGMGGVWIALILFSVSRI